MKSNDSQRDWLDALLRGEAERDVPNDAGFSAMVLRALPARRVARRALAVARWVDIAAMGVAAALFATMGGAAFGALGEAIRVGNLSLGAIEPLIPGLALLCLLGWRAVTTALED